MRVPSMARKIDNRVALNFNTNSALKEKASQLSDAEGRSLQNWIIFHVGNMVANAPTEAPEVPDVELTAAVSMKMRDGFRDRVDALADRWHWTRTDVMNWALARLTEQEGAK